MRSPRLLICLLTCTLCIHAAARARGGDPSGDGAAVPAVGDLPGFEPNQLLNFQVPRAHGEVRVDGRLDDPGWTGAARLDNFTEVNPGEIIQPKVETEAYFTYDDHNLYVGFVCYDDPREIRASITDRDAIFQDDFIGIMVDTFRDEQNAYEFFVNPYGIQGDLRNNRGNEDSNYDAVWSSAGQITESGWTAEMAIPFRSIRFPDAEEQQWGIHVLRIRPRSSREQISWAPISRDENCLFCGDVAGTLTGIEGIHSGRNLEVLPYVIGGKTSWLDGGNLDEFQWNDEATEADAGGSLKYGITSNYTLDFTYNPDFSQIESDATQINANQTFALFFPERRPFFLEGADIFDTMVNAVYTRSINDPLTAGKVTGKSGATTMGVMAAYDRISPYIVPFSERSEFAEGGRTATAVARVKQDVLEGSFVGAMVTDRRRDEPTGGANTTASVDTRLRFFENYAIAAQLTGSNTVEPDDTTLTEDWDAGTFGKENQYTSAFDGEDFVGHALEVNLSRSARHWNFQTWYEEYSPTFRAENGFIVRNNYRMAGLWTGYMIQVDDHPVFERIEPQVSLGRWFNFDGIRIDEWLEPSIWVRFKGQTSVWTSMIYSSERFSGELVPGIRRWQGELYSAFSSVLSGGVYWRVGQTLVRDTDDPRLGFERTTNFWMEVKPTPQLKANVTYNIFDLSELDSPVGISEQQVTRLRLTYQFTPRLFLRAIGEYVDWGGNESFLSVDPLLSYKINPFTVFFVGSSHAYTGFADDTATPGDDRGMRETARTFFVKFQYLFRV